MGVHSTAPFLGLLLEECRRQYGARHEQDYPRMVVYAWPIPFYPDRPVDHDAVKAVIHGALAALQDTGIDFIAMPCNIAHLYFDELQREARVPLLNMVDLAVEEIPLGGGPAALLATRATRDAALYQRRLERRGVPVIDSEPLQHRIDALLLHIKRGHSSESQHDEWMEILDSAQELGAQIALVACTDLNAAMDLAGPRRRMQVVDGTQTLAARTISRWCAAAQIATSVA
jgi:aspartate/glutamate racemase